VYVDGLRVGYAMNGWEVKRMLKYLVVVCLLALVAVPAQADNLAVEVVAAGEVVVQEVQLSILGGLGDPAIGLYWPLASSEKLGLSVGPIGAFGSELVIGGLGATIPVSIDAPILEELDFLWGGYAYNWKSKNGSLEGGVGTTFDVNF